MNTSPVPSVPDLSVVQALTMLASFEDLLLAAAVKATSEDRARIHAAFPELPTEF